MQAFMKALAWTFVHSLWQGLLAALLAAVIISLTRKSKARLRYNLLGFVFVLFLVVVSISFLSRFHPGQQEEIASVSSSALTAITGNETARIIDDNATQTISGGFITDLSSWFNNNTDILIFTWLLFFFVNCLKLFTGLATVNRLRHYKTYPVSEDWKIKLEQWREGLGINKSISLLQSELVKVPVALGYLKPMILLPVGLLANIPPEQVEAILLHELGHIRRKDYLVNLLQRFAESIFFFNPALLWISSLLREEREACCDDFVIAKTGQTRNYLNALVSFQEYSLAHNFYAMGISNRRQHLLARVKRILTNENKKLNLFEKAALLSGVVLFFGFTYIEQKESKEVLLNTPVVKAINIQQSVHPSTEKALVGSATEPARNEMKKTDPIYKAVTDTVPDKKSVPVIPDTNLKIKPTEAEWQKVSGNDWKISKEKDWSPSKENDLKISKEKDWNSTKENDLKISKEKDWNSTKEHDWKISKEKRWENDTSDIKTVLHEIEQLKNKIGIKKESIGFKKEKLGMLQGKDPIEEKALKHEIDKERREVDENRGELERKRLLLENLRMQNEKKKQDGKISKPKSGKEISTSDSPTILSKIYESKPSNEVEKIKPDKIIKSPSSPTPPAKEVNRADPAQPKIKTAPAPVKI